MISFHRNPQSDPPHSIMPLDTTPKTNTSRQRRPHPHRSADCLHYQEQSSDQPPLNIHVSEQSTSQALEERRRQRQLFTMFRGWVMSTVVAFLAGVVIGMYVQSLPSGDTSGNKETEVASAALTPSKLTPPKTEAPPTVATLDPDQLAVISDDAAELPQTPAIDDEEPLTLLQLTGGQIPSFDHVLENVRLAVFSNNFDQADRYIALAEEIVTTPKQKAELNGARLLYQRSKGFNQ